jgi:UDP-glucose 6-dehydrogenase
VVEASQALMLANLLARGGISVTAYDPLAHAAAAAELDDSVLLAPSLEACVAASDVLVIAVPWPQFQELPALLSQQPARALTLVDCWRCLDVHHLPAGVGIVYIGQHAGQGTPVDVPDHVGS